MLDERIHAAEGRLEGRKPTRGLFRNVEEDLDTICNPLPLCWETLSRQWADHTEDVESARIDFDRSSLGVAFETWRRFRERSWV